MMELITRTARLVPYAKRPKHGPGYVTAIIIEPEAGEADAKLGSLFVVIEVLVAGRPGEDIVGIITGTFQTVYYAKHESDITTLDRFEAAVKATNTALSESVNQGNAAWIGKLSAVVAVQAGTDLHLTHSGSAEAYLYRHSAQTRITTPSSAKPAGPAKTFGMVASGQLESGDRLLLSTPALVHQIALKRLHSTVSGDNPNAAIAELTEVLRGSDTSRIAALIIEIITPEQAALQVRSEQPAEVMLGTPETALQSAKLITAPLAEATITAGKTTGRMAQAGWSQAKPGLRRASLGATNLARSAISGERIAQRSLMAIIIIGLIVGGFAWHVSRQRATQKIVSSYQSDYAHYQAALELPIDQKRAALVSVSTTLNELIKGSSAAAIDATLKSTSLKSGAPTSVTSLQEIVSKALDSLDHLVSVTPTTLATFTSPSGVKPTLLEASGSNIYAVDTQKNVIIVVNKSTKTQKKLVITIPSFGHIKAIAAFSTGDGIFILTDTPGVWSYKLGDSSATKVSAGISGWETANAIDSYNGNIYLLSMGQVVKHVSTTTGFATGTNYFSAPLVPIPTAIGVDGYVYIADPTAITQYLGGAAKASLTIPSGLTNITTIKADNDGHIIGIDHSSGRIGVWNDATGFSFITQYQLKGTAKLTDSVYDQTAQTYYALVGNALVSFQPSN